MGTTVIPRKWGLPSENYHGNDGDGEKHHGNTAVMGLNHTVIPRLWMCVLAAEMFTYCLLTYLRLFAQQFCMRLCSCTSKCCCLCQSI